MNQSAENSLAPVFPADAPGHPSRRGSESDAGLRNSTRNSKWTAALATQVLRFRWLLFLVALLPSGIIALAWHDQPFFGLVDDPNYFTTAKAIAQGDGYRLISLPGEPAQTKYPPLWPAVLSLVWRISPQFPENLSLALLVIWLNVPLVLWCLWRLLRVSGIDPPAAALVCGLTATIPIFVQLGLILMSELPFMALAFGALYFAERASREERMLAALLAGLLAALALLTRTAGVALAAGIALVFLGQRRYRHLAPFLIPVALAAVGWASWMLAHPYDVLDPALVWYGSYAEMYREGLAAKLPMLAVNAGMLLLSGTQFLMFDGESLGYAPLLRAPVFLLSVWGVGRLVRRGKLRHYAVFGACYVALVLMNYTAPNPRYLLPVAPLLLLGAGEMLGVAAAWCARMVRMRRVALAPAIAIGLAAMLSLGANLHGVVEQTGKMARISAELQWDMQPIFDQVREQTRPEDRILSAHDAILYLNTGRQGIALHPSSSLIFYFPDEAELDRFFLDTGHVARRLGLTWAVLAPTDMQLNQPELTRERWHRAVQREFILREQLPEASLYQRRDLGPDTKLGALNAPAEE